MNQQIVQSQLEDVRTVLNNSVQRISSYLNQHCLNQMLKEDGSRNEDYYSSLLKSLRRLEVFCDEAHDAVHVILQSEVFRKPAAEKTLYGIYHQCIMEFFSPKGDIWYENSRAAYTGKNAIMYHHTPPASFETLIHSLENGFQQLREELAYYEADYQRKSSPS